ncbi:hypothetical protein Clacol_005497 [Clathrus columnatus]|uniref:Protein BFR2 n=1 Tax=Clathrus columnatus TaxID=1419009 RepID=A0AAV5AAC0_9AGAM|nr:hypothetical protein Clacol_005497 [Clathrus columnatus]
MARLTLAQQLAQIEDTLPQDYDPEDLYGGTANENENKNVEDGEQEPRDNNAGREHYIEVGPSALRSINEDLNDQKYESVKVSRSKLLVEEEDEKEDDSDNADDQIDDTKNSSGEDSSSSEEEDPITDGEEEEQSSIKKQQKRQRSESISGNKTTDGLDLTLQKTRQADKLKGQAVSRQLRIWDVLVDSRIQLQKAVLSSNKLPPPQSISKYTSVPDAQPAVRRYLSQAFRLSEELFQLRRALLEHAGSLPPPPKKQRTDLDLEDENVDFQTLFKESVEEMMEFEAQIHETDLSTLQKWSAKVQAVAPSALLPSSKVSFKGGPIHTKSAGELVDEALKASEKLIEKTRCRVNRIGSIPLQAADEEKDENDVDEETFDDRDFYQSMLRDVIESKGGKEAIIDLYSNSKKQRKKKKVDTKASKGRKLRYEPHEKILNFMVPVPVKGAWHEEQINELFASLLGKGFEDISKPNGGDVDMSVAPDQSALQGFRIFG